MKNSFDVGVTDSLERASYSRTRTNMITKVVSPLVNEQIKERGQDDEGTMESQNGKEMDEISQDNPLCGYISFDNTHSKEQIQTQTSIEMALNPTLHSK